ncbi:MAG: hypothetical protein AB8H03_00795 [Saprospiraceae bacterium]
MDKRIICLLLLFIFSNCNFSKKITGLKSNKDHPTFLETENFGIRVKPILNREYLIFLSWYISVYGSSYPEKVMSILPKESLNPDYGSNFEIDEILNASTSILKNYIFNPKYIDYPLIGLSLPQVMEMQRWMSDRYNENILIEKGFINFNLNQKDEESFSLESFLVDQYVGSVRKTISNKSWKKEYLPTFRLPYQNEINSIKTQSDYDTQLKKYSFGKKDFLWKWTKDFLKVLPKENKIILGPHFYPIEIICKNNFSTTNKTFTDAILTDKNLEFINKKYLDLGNTDGVKDQYEGGYPFNEKNRFGQMEFVIVGIDEKNRPIIAEPIQMQNDTFSRNKIFRIAFNKTLENQHLPDK